MDVNPNNFGRAQSWAEVFSSSDEQETAFNFFIERFLSEYRSNNSLEKVETVEVDGIKEHRIYRKNAPRNSSTIISLQSNGDLVLKFIRDNSIKEKRIVPGTGNSDHDFTLGYVLQEVVPSKKETRILEKKFGNLAQKFYFHIRGKPATEDWEKIMIENCYEPMRIGYSLYIREVLEMRRELTTINPVHFAIRSRE